MISSSGSSSNSQFDVAIQEEWWQAVFGLNSIGLAVFKATISQQWRLPSNKDKLGVTISRLVVLVRSIQPKSPAALAGVPLHDVLLDISGILLLAELTPTALERLWRYVRSRIVEWITLYGCVSFRMAAFERF